MKHVNKKECASCCEKLPVWTVGNPKAYWRKNLKPGENWYFKSQVAGIPASGGGTLYNWINFIPSGVGNQTRQGNRIKINYIMISVMIYGASAYLPIQMWLAVDKQTNGVAPAITPITGTQTSVFNYDYTDRWDFLWGKSAIPTVGEFSTSSEDLVLYYQEGWDLCEKPITTTFNQGTASNIASVNTGGVCLMVASGTGDQMCYCTSVIIYEEY